MRVLYFIILLIVIAAVVIFTVQNRETVTIQYFKWQVSSPLPLLIAIVYALGMITGWSVVGFLKRSLQRVSERPRQ